MSQPKVSIIIPIYNAGEFLTQCLDSLVNQTLREIEIICVLDCPTDGSDKMAEQYAANDSRIKIIKNQENLHIGESRNRGLDAASGEYIGFCDHDDYFDLDALEHMYKVAKTGNHPIVETYDPDINFHKQFDSKDIIKQSVEIAFAALVSERNTVFSPSIWTHLYSRTLLQEASIQFVDTKQIAVEDRIFNVAVFSHLLNAGIKDYPFIPYYCYHHVFHSNNANATYSYRQLEHVMAYLNTIGTMVYTQTQNMTKYGHLYTECVVRELYGSARKEMRVIGLKKTIRKLNSIKQYLFIARSLAEYKQLYNKYLTLPKNIFVALLKGICQTNHIK